MVNGVHMWPPWTLLAPMKHAKSDRSTRTNWEWEIPNCPRNIVVSEPVPCSLFFWGVGGGGATHWTTDMFIVSANIFGWSLSGQVWSYFSYYRPCLSCGGPCPGFCTCSKLLVGHYIIPQLLYCIVRRNYTSTASTCHTAHSVLWAMQCLGAGACIRCIVMIELELDGGACNSGKIFKEISFSPTRWEGWPRWILRASEEARRQRTKNHTMPSLIVRLKLR